jgi:hypothetical protein
MSEKNLNRQDGFQRSFVVDLDPQAVWDAIRRPPRADHDGRTRYNLPGFEADCLVVDSEAASLLRVIKDEEPCKGTEIVISLAHEGSGTRITVVQSGFGPWLPDVLEMFGYVWNMIVADLALYIETGIQIKTHLFQDGAPTVELGCKTADALSGLRVTDVDAGGFCQRAGIRQGDLLLKMGQVRLVHTLQLQSLLHMCKPGDPVSVTWARSGALMNATSSF